MSLLLEALKKASEDKQRQMQEKPSDDAGRSAQVQKPAPSPVKDNEQDGGQLFDLLQGKNDGSEDDSLDNLSGQLKGGDEKPSSDEALPSFSLSLLEDDQGGDSEAAKPVKAPENLAVDAELPFELELLGDEPEVDTGEIDKPASSEPQADLSGLSLVDDDDLSSTVNDTTAPDGPESTPEREESLDEVEALVTRLSNDTETSAATSQLDTDTPSLQPTKPDLDVSPTNTEPDRVEAAAVDGTPNVVEQGAETPDTSKAVKASQPALAEVAEKAPVVPSSPPPEARTEPKPAAKFAPDQPTGPTPGPATPLEAIPADRASTKQEAAPDMVLDALKRQKRRRRVLVLLLIWIVGMLAGGWGYLMFLEQQEDNTRALARYRLPKNTVSGAPQAQLETPTQLQQSLSDPEAVSALEEQLELLGGVVDSISDPIESVAESDAAAVADAISDALVAPVKQVASSIVEEEEEVVEEEVVSDVTEAESAVTIKRRSAEKRILTESQTLGIERRQTQTREMAAFNAFQQGDYSRARQLYQKALAENALSRDAVMGLAALAAVERDYTRAADYYRQLLDYDPSDRAAFEGLIGLPEQGGDAVDMESRLRTYLKHDPNSARAYSKLGQILARQQRWYDAQQSFFNAYRLDSSNPAYALNVAIALDHLRKYTPAKQYYERVLQMAETQPEGLSLNLVSVRKRLTALSQLEK